MGNSQNKPKGWHSRRHETSEAQTIAREAYENRADNRPAQEWDHTQKIWVKLNA